jgi:hypothetical protein
MSLKTYFEKKQAEIIKAKENFGLYKYYIERLPAQ